MLADDGKTLEGPGEIAWRLIKSYMWAVQRLASLNPGAERDILLLGIGSAVSSAANLGAKMEGWDSDDPRIGTVMREVHAVLVKNFSSMPREWKLMLDKPGENN